MAARELKGIYMFKHKCVDTLMRCTFDIYMGYRTMRGNLRISVMKVMVEITSIKSMMELVRYTTC